MQLSSFRFELLHRSKRSGARLGRIHTPSGIIDTPNFVPVATNAAIKTADSLLINPLDIQLLFCNTYHLMLHPGVETIALAGGLHQFMRRKQPIITDSGGFQVFSLAYGSVKDELKSRGQKKQEGSVVKITEEGVLFRSYRDGRLLLLTPESSIASQKKLGADIIIPLDELPPYHIDPKQLRDSFDRTHRWQKRSLEAHLQEKRGQAIYGVVHGGVDDRLRIESARFLAEAGFDGLAVGGSLGKTREEMVQMLKTLLPQIVENYPRHLLGIGDQRSMEAILPLGFDTFDSSYPTKCARHGVLLSEKESLNITKTCYRDDFSFLFPECSCVACSSCSKAYLHHLFKAHETSAHTLATVHNLHFMNQWMRSLRERIAQDLL